MGSSFCLPVLPLKAFACPPIAQAKSHLSCAPQRRDLHESAVEILSLLWPSTGIAPRLAAAAEGVKAATAMLVRVVMSAAAAAGIAAPTVSCHLITLSATGKPSKLEEPTILLATRVRARRSYEACETLLWRQGQGPRECKCCKHLEALVFRLSDFTTFGVCQSTLYEIEVCQSTDQCRALP